jgi:hypothetical protein
MYFAFAFDRNDRCSYSLSLSIESVRFWRTMNVVMDRRWIFGLVVVLAAGRGRAANVTAKPLNIEASDYL